MKHTTAIIAILLSLSTAAQQWATIGATWHYRWTINSGPPYPPTSGYHRFESLLDTVINGQATRKVASAWTTLFTHATNGVVWIYVPSTAAFDTLYNFNAVPGDHWSMVPMPDPFVCTNQSRVEVVDTGTTTINDIQLRWLAVENHNITEDFDLVEADTIVERLGSKAFYLLPHEFCNSMVSPGVIGFLLCYADAEVAYMRPSIQDCELGMGITTNSRSEGMQLFPNPGQEGFDLILPSGFDGLFTVYDAHGSIVLGPVSSSRSSHVDAGEWPSGLYSIQFLPIKGLPVSKQWVKW